MGARARDWADIQEGMARPVYEAVLDRTAVGTGIRYLDVGCGSGMAAQLAAVRGLNAAGAAVRAMENTSEQAVSEAHAKAIAPFLQSNGRYRIKASFRCLLARP